jgi:CheY-like chemotaxis protein
MSQAYRRSRALVLEDERAEARLATRILENDGYEVETVHDGEDALALLGVDDPCPFDVLVLDLRMPGLSGLHVVRYILHHRRDLIERVLIVSSASPKDHPEMSGKPSLDIPWLLKPYLPADLVEKANSIADGAGATVPRL